MKAIIKFFIGILSIFLYATLFYYFVNWVDSYYLFWPLTLGIILLFIAIPIWIVFMMNRKYPKYSFLVKRNKKNRRKETKNTKVVVALSIVSTLLVVLVFGLLLIFYYGGQPLEDNSDGVLVDAMGEVFYTTGVVNVRSCASLSCEVIGQYPVNTELTLPFATEELLPEWVEINLNYNDAGEYSPRTGYINRVGISKSKTKIIYQQVNTQETTNIPNAEQIISDWINSIAYIECAFYYKGEKEPFTYQRGSGTLFNEEALFTNKHVILRNGQYTPNECMVYFPNAELSFEATLDDIYFSNGDEDFARIIPPESFNTKDVTPTNIRFCLAQAPLGSEVIILGFPSIGALGSVTVTDGIISGYEDGHYITSAKIDHGNSGGAAILVEGSNASSCYLGVPTFVNIGEIESLGRIFDIRNFLD